MYERKVRWEKTKRNTTETVTRKKKDYLALTTTKAFHGMDTWRIKCSVAAAAVDLQVALQATAAFTQAKKRGQTSPSILYSFAVFTCSGTAASRIY